MISANDQREINQDEESSIFEKEKHFSSDESSSSSLSIHVSGDSNDDEKLDDDDTEQKKPIPPPVHGRFHSFPTLKKDQESKKEDHRERKTPFLYPVKERQIERQFLPEDEFHLFHQWQINDQLSVSSLSTVYLLEPRRSDVMSDCETSTTMKETLRPHLSSLSEVVLKISWKGETSEYEFIQNELDMLKQCQGHPNIIPLLESWTNERLVASVFPFCSRRDLYEILNSQEDTVGTSMIFRWAKELIDAVDHLHSTHGIAHRDLKLENVLIDEGDHVRLCDFGFALRDGHQLVTGSPGSLFYVAPEVLFSSQRGPYSPILSDLWSLGVCLYLMLFREHPYDGPESNKEDIPRILKHWRVKKPPIHTIPSLPLWNVCRSLLHRNPNQRIRTGSLKRTPFYLSSSHRS